MEDAHDPSKRRTLIALAQTGAILPLAAVWGASCGSGGSSSAGTTAQGTGGSTTGVPQASWDANKWATGGVAAMTAKASYPSPIFAEAGATCALTCQATAGPCYLASGSAPVREDVSEGQDGLPMRLVFKLVDDACAPLSGATVQIWHCSPAGLYSGDTPNEAFCSASNQAAISAQWMRGTAVSQADGTVVFDSCFPGWYTSRTIHVHVAVKTVSGDTATTQFFFDDALCDAIIASQPLYKDRGSRDTTNQNDTVVSAAAAPAYCFDVAQMTDGAMLASKRIVLRSSTQTSLCTLPGGTGGGTGASPTAPGGPAPGTKKLAMFD